MSPGRSLGRRSLCNSDDWWSRVVDGCLIEFSCNINSVNKSSRIRQLSKSDKMSAKLDATSSY